MDLEVARCLFVAWVLLLVTRRPRGGMSLPYRSVRDILFSEERQRAAETMRRAVSATGES